MTAKEYEELAGLAFPATNATRSAFEAGAEFILQSIVKDLRERKDAAYTERNTVVALLARLFPSGIAKTAIPGWSDDWHGCVYIELPTGQVSWHYHDSHAWMFEGLAPYTKQWDGHTTEEKYSRVVDLIASYSDDYCSCGTCVPPVITDFTLEGGRIATHQVSYADGAFTDTPLSFNEGETLIYRSSDHVIPPAPPEKVEGITVGERWEHHSGFGRIYEVIGFANQYTEHPDKFPIHVLYRDLNGRVWTRPLAEFLQKFRRTAQEDKK